MLTNKAGRALSAFEAMEIEILRTDGVAALSKSLDGTLRVFLLTDTPEVRARVLQIVGDKLSNDKVVFEPQQPSGVLP